MVKSQISVSSVQEKKIGSIGGGYVVVDSLFNGVAVLRLVLVLQCIKH